MKNLIFMTIFIGVGQNACKNETNKSTTKFWDLPEIIEEAKSSGIIDDIFSVEGDCKEAFENKDDSDRCVTKQKAIKSLIKSCQSQSAETADGIEEPDNLDSDAKIEESDRFRSCYEAGLGFSRVMLGEAKAEMEINDNDEKRNIYSSLSGDINLFEKPVDIFMADISADALNLGAQSSVMVFGKEVFAFDKRVPDMEFAYTGDAPKKFEIRYGLPIPRFLVNPELKAGLDVTGDMYLAMKPFSRSNNELNFNSRATGTSYIRPSSSASFEIFGVNIFNATVGGFAQPFSDDMINSVDLRRKESSRFVSKEHKSSFMKGSLFAEANLLTTKYYHFFFNEPSNSQDAKSCGENPHRPLCPCSTNVTKLSNASDKDDNFEKTANAEESSLTENLVCDPISSRWMAVSRPMWFKAWADYLWESRK